MAALAKAVIREIKGDQAETDSGQAFPVQFNPTSLKLAYSNEIEGGKSRGRQARQYIGKSSTDLTVELIFDTADEATGDGEPRSVREKVNQLEKFVLPATKGKEEPRKLRFEWGGVVVAGIVSKLDVDFDHFAADGKPLRAKVGFSIKEQDTKYQFLESGPGAKDSGGATQPGEPPPGAPGSAAKPPTEQVAPALGEETPAEFASRMGLDPNAWRGLDADLGLDLSLSAGLEVGFSASLGVDIGIGFEAGIELGIDASLEASFGLEADAGASAGAGLAADTSAGFALSAAGGIGAAIDSVKIEKAKSATSEAITAFDAPAAGASGAAAATATRSPAVSGAAAATNGGNGTGTARRPSRQPQPRRPLGNTGSPGALGHTAPGAAPAPPVADPRAASFGFGVPLRPRVSVAAADRQAADGGLVLVRRRGDAGGGTAVPFTRDPTIPAWVELPLRDRSRAQADAIQANRRPRKACGCLVPCQHPRGDT